jgi:hypothetical protein
MVPDGTIVYTAYDNTDGSGNSHEGTVDIFETWINPEGRTNMKSMVTMAAGMSWMTLTRTSSDGTTLEVQTGTDTINPNGPQHSLYYRK